MWRLEAEVSKLTYYYKENLLGELEQLDPEDLAKDFLTALCQQLHQAQVDKGFWDTFWDERPLNWDRKLLLIVGEVAEAHEELRSHDDPKHVYYREDGKPEGFAFELADVFIRLADLAGALGIDLGAAVAEKHAFNQTRPHKHGRLF
jgi:NTP pyrophosphatase (non-canonical NTP hydrolase)